MRVESNARFLVQDWPIHGPGADIPTVYAKYKYNINIQSRGDGHKGERLRVLAQGTMFNSLLRLCDSRPFDAQE